MACGTNIVPGYKEFNNKANEIAKNPALDMKMNQLGETLTRLPFAGTQPLFLNA